MTVALAAAAGCPQIVVCTPPGPDGTVNPALLYALREAGATEIYKIGGAQAIAAMALGTRTIAPVVKVYGPGNSYVVEAKRQLFGMVGVDLLPGPSEIMVLSDSSGKAAWIASDLLAQAEHGPDSEIGFVTDSEPLLAAVERELAAQVKTLTRQGPLRRSSRVAAFLCWWKNSRTASTSSTISRRSTCRSSAAERSPCCRRSARRARSLSAITRRSRSAISSPARATNCRPAARAKAFPVCTVDQFQRRTSIVKLDRESIRKSAPIAKIFADIEGLDAHGRSATIRTEDD